MTGCSIVVADVLEGLAALAPGSVQLVVSSPPYGIGKAYERGADRLDLDGYRRWMGRVAEATARVLAADGSVCWQVGNAVVGGRGIVPLDALFHPIFTEAGLVLRSRAFWVYGSGLHETRRFSGRHETLSRWTRPGGGYLATGPVGIATPTRRGTATTTFDPEADFAPEAVWEVPNVKANHPERTAHPCAFPSEIARRCIVALSRPGDLVLDPFAGSGTTGACAAVHGRRFVGIERDAAYAAIARGRIADAAAGRSTMRPPGPPAAPGARR